MNQINKKFIKACRGSKYNNTKVQCDYCENIFKAISEKCPSCGFKYDIYYCKGHNIGVCKECNLALHATYC